MKQELLILTLVFIIQRCGADITNTNVPVGACLCVDGSNVNIRSYACGSVLEQANNNQCYRHTGNRQTCTLNGNSYKFFELKNVVDSQEGHCAGTFLNVGDGSSCGSDQVTGTRPTYGTCLEATTGVNVREAPCSSVILGVATSGSKVIYHGLKSTCLHSNGNYYEYFAVTFQSQTGYIASPFLRVSSTTCADYNCFGDISLLTPTGAGSSTASGSGYPSLSGVAASNAIAAYDLPDIADRWNAYQLTGDNLCLEPALLAALASRESRAGRVLTVTNGWGDYRNEQYNGYGILQCDVHTSGLQHPLTCTTYSWDSQEHMQMVIDNVLIDKIICVQGKEALSSWAPERKLQGGVAAYNFGCKSVKTWGNLDGGSTGNDYSNDVIARAQYIKDNIQAKLDTL